MERIIVDEETCLEVSNILNDVFLPLRGFVDKKNYDSILNTMHLCSGEPWPIPISLAVSHEKSKQIKIGSEIILKNSKGNDLAILAVSELFKVDYSEDIKKLFGTDSTKHPGVEKEQSRSNYRVAGELRKVCAKSDRHSDFELFPSEVKEIIKKNKWKNIVGFQTRNPPHRAHEYLQRVGLELADALFIHPLIGWKKSGDFSPDAVTSSYKILVENYYPTNRVLLAALHTPMRYAGPREAVFHALIRKNFGCTHFIVGRDHAGVGNFYGKYEAQNLAKNINNLGIEILDLAGPQFCSICEGIVSERSCGHSGKEIEEVSGTLIRSLLKDGRCPPSKLMRPKIASYLANLPNNDCFVQ